MSLLYQKKHSKLIAACQPAAIVRIAEWAIPGRSRVHECWCREESEWATRLQMT